MPKIGLFAKDIEWVKIPVAVLTTIWLLLFFLSGQGESPEPEASYLVTIFFLGLSYPMFFYRPGQGFKGNLLKVEFLITVSAVFNILMIKVFYPSHHLLGFFQGDGAGSYGILTLWLFAFLLAPLLLVAAQSQRRLDRRNADRVALLKAAKTGAVISAVEEETGQPVSPELAKKISSLS